MCVISDIGAQRTEQGHWGWEWIWEPSADAQHSPFMQLPFIGDPKSMLKHVRIQVPFQSFQGTESSLANLSSLIPNIFFSIN